MISSLPMSFGLLCLVAITSTRTADGARDQSPPRPQHDSSQERRHCDEDFCESIVTKCRASERCTCDLKQVDCAKDCLDCLEEKFGKCCACVDLCPALKEDVHSSHVGDINETSYEELFDVLTETDDIFGRWSIANSSSSKQIFHPELGHMHVALAADNKKLVLKSPPAAGGEVGLAGDADDQGYGQDDNQLNEGDTGKQPRNCVVAFINRHLSMSQCKRYCRSMGASSFRWFHEGCCECVGKYCIHYGIDRPKCSIQYES